MIWFWDHFASRAMRKIRVRKPEAPSQPIVWWKIALGTAIFLVAVGVFWMISNALHSIPTSYERANGKILEIRKVVDGTQDSGYGGTVIYGFEARVLYTVDGKPQERWLRASGDMPRETLAIKLAGHPTECLVYWPPDHPEDAKCWLK